MAETLLRGKVSADLLLLPNVHVLNVQAGTPVLLKLKDWGRPGRGEWDSCKAG